MTVATAHPTRTGWRAAFAKTSIVETKLFLRDPGSYFLLLFPAGLLLALGAVMPGFLDATDELGGQRPIDVYAPVAVIAGIATAALLSVPITLTGYRERGVLRRLATTPARPAMVLTGQLLVNLVGAAASVLLALAAGWAVFNVVLPSNPAGFILATLLATMATFGLGLLLAAILPTVKIANAAAPLLYFPLLFFAGLWLPLPMMPDGLRQVAEYTPLGAAVEAMQDSWTGGWPAGLHLAVLAGYFVLSSAAAIRLFRWQ